MKRKRLEPEVLLAIALLYKDTVGVYRRVNPPLKGKQVLTVEELDKIMHILLYTLGEDTPERSTVEMRIKSALSKRLGTYRVNEMRNIFTLIGVLSESDKTWLYDVCN